MYSVINNLKISINKCISLKYERKLIVGDKFIILYILVDMCSTGVETAIKDKLLIIKKKITRIFLSLSLNFKQLKALNLMR